MRRRRKPPITGTGVEKFLAIFLTLLISGVLIYISFMFQSVNSIVFSIMISFSITFLICMLLNTFRLFIVVDHPVERPKERPVQRNTDYRPRENYADLEKTEDLRNK